MAQDRYWDEAAQKWVPISASHVEFVTHKADYLSHTGLAIATGLANNYIATLDPPLSAYKEGVSFRLKINVANTGASTVNVNGLGAKAIKKKNGNALAAGNLKAGLYYQLLYDGTSFQLADEGGEDLTELITLTNAAERNEDTIRAGVASALSSNGVPASPTDTWVVLTDKINKFIGPEKVSGTVTSSAAGVVTVTGLPFKPARIELVATTNPFEIQTLYDEAASAGATLYFNIPLGNAGAKAISSVGGSVTATSFTLPFLNGNSGAPYGTNYPIKWTAYRKKGG